MKNVNKHLAILNYKSHAGHQQCAHFPNKIQSQIVNELPASQWNKVQVHAIMVYV
jgi:hypothetical protein